MGDDVARPGRVVLLHGIGRTGRSMAGLERALLDAGFATLNLSYKSREKRLEALVEDVREAMRDFLAAPSGPAHFVCHSMGGLLARAYIGRYRPVTLGRVVMLGTPNGGSELADLLAGNPVYDFCFGPAGRQLGTRRDAETQALLGGIDYPVGVIAGDVAVEPFGWLVLPKPNDGKVSVGGTRVAGMADHLVLHQTHDSMLLSRTVRRQMIHFLREGRFAAV